MLALPFRTLAITYIILITAGSILLMLPFATASTQSIPEIIFTVVSSITLIGFTVTPIEESFTVFGEVVILLLIQAGGFLLMLFSTLLLIEFGRNKHVHKLFSYSITSDGFNQTLLKHLSKKIILFMLVIESIGVVILTLKWTAQLGFGKALYYAIFHTVSAFNNAGAALWSNSLSHYSHDWIINMTISSLFIVGGLGYLVWMDIFTKKQFTTLTVHSKIMIIGTLILNTAGTILFFKLERNQSLLGMETGEALWISYFQTATMRSAGFTTISLNELSLLTLLFMAVLMLIGAGSGSTGSGLKVSTITIILYSLYSYLVKRTNPTIHRKMVPTDAILKALLLLTSSLVFIFVLLLFFITQYEINFFHALFEAVSLTGMVGVSLGIISNMALPVEHIIIATFMLLARLGPLYIGYVWVVKQEKSTEETASVFVG